MKVRILLICLAGLVLASCAGLKKKDRPRYDMFDNLTSKYNIRYHGRMILSQTQQQQKAAHREDFRNLLPVFIEPTESTAASSQAMMDSVIGKSRRIINEKYKGKYIGDAYFILGEANYLKGNYYHASEFFAYVASNYAKPKYKQPALIWQARTLMQLGSLTEAGLVLDSVTEGLDTYKRARGMAYATLAKYQLLRGDNQQAIIALSNAIRHSHHKSDKIRWHFLLGQLMEAEGHHEYAISHYRKVALSNADYEMIFHANLNRTFLQSSVDPDGGRQIAALRRMLRDDKNREYRDQILYYIAETYIQRDDHKTALEYYRRSLDISSGNRHQTTQTHLRLGDYFLEAKAYDRVGLHYDSAGMFLPIDFPDALSVQKRLGSMDRLISGFKTIEKQDTLQYLASLDSVERNIRISEIAAERYQAMTVLENTSSRGRTRPAQQSQLQLSPFDQLLPQENAQAYTDQRFYFNNPDAIGMGVAAFRRKWGQTTLRDNWRLSDIRDNSADTDLAEESTEPGSDETDQNGSTGSGTLDRDATMAKLRLEMEENLPLSEEAMLASHQQIKTALQEIGEIYRFTLHEPQNSIRAYESLLERYPMDADKASWYYNLYLLHVALNSETAEIYKAKLYSEFPETAFSHILQDPDYLKGMESSRQESNLLYAEIFGDYTERRYAQVISRVDALLNNQTVRSAGQQAQLAYLKSLAIGHTAAIERFEHALQILVETYPTDSLVVPLTRQHLSYIEENREDFTSRPYALVERDTTPDGFLPGETVLTPWPQLLIKGGSVPLVKAELIEPVRQVSVREPTQPVRIPETVTAPVSRTTRDLKVLPDSSTYYFVITVQNPRVNLAPSRFGIGQFNRGRYPNAGLSHQLKPVNNEAQLVFIGPFRTFGEVKQYESQILPLLSDIMKIPTDIYHTFIITESVFGTLSDFEKIENYRSFYQGQPVH